MRPILIAAILAAFAVAPATAQAGAVYDSGAFAEDRWEQIAGFRPCGGQIVYRFKDLPASRGGQAILYRRAVREEFGLVCRVELAESLRSRLYGDRELLCTLVLHEVGHLTGRRHNRNPRSVMYGGPLEIDERCAGR
jgi:hypothetical protein